MATENNLNYLKDKLMFGVALTIQDRVDLIDIILELISARETLERMKK